MKKKIAAALAATFALGVTSAFAANPFTDVPAKHWAYESVSKLQKAGIVEGYSNGQFGGEKSMTRYEMAIVVAKAMTKMEKADAEQKATINKLAAEFGAELKNLGVRVETLEKNQPNLKFNGELHFRYSAQSFDDNVTATNTRGDYRLRMEGNAKVDDATSYGMRLVSTQTKAGTDAPYYSATFNVFGTSSGISSDTKNSFSLDRVFVARQMGAVKTTLGAQKFSMGTTNFIIDSTAYSYDGLKFEGKSGVVNMAAQWGRMVNAIDVASLELSSKQGKLTYGAGYLKMTNNTGSTQPSTTTAGGDLAKIITGNVKYDFDSKFSIAGEYVKNNVSPNAQYTNDKKNNAFDIVAVYGDQVLKKEGDNNFRVAYFNVGNNSIGRWSSFELTNVVSGTAEATQLPNQKGWNVSYNYAFSNNFTGYLAYHKVSDDQKDYGANGDRGYKYYRIGMLAKF